MALALPAASSGCRIKYRKAPGCTARSAVVRRVSRDGAFIAISGGKFVSVAPSMLVSIKPPAVIA